MAAEGKKSPPDKPISDSQRFRYIGFEVYPGKPKDLFKGEAERNKFVDAIRARREKGDVIRDDCKLYEKRVSGLDRIVLTIASLVILGSLFIPWFTAYNETVEETEAAAQTSEQQAPSGEAAVTDSVPVAGDTLAAVAPSQMDLDPGDTVTPVTSVEARDADPDVETGEAEGREVVSKEPKSDAEEVIVGMKARKKIHRDYDRTSAVGVFAGMGTIGSLVFSSGFVLILSGVLVLLYILSCIGLPIYTLYGLYGLKGDEDTKALKVKKTLKFNWIPVILFVILMVISSFGAEYGFDPMSYYTSLGDSYSIGTLFSVMSWGMVLTLCGFILKAVKGIEI